MRLSDTTKWSSGMKNPIALEDNHMGALCAGQKDNSMKCATWIGIIALVAVQIAGNAIAETGPRRMTLPTENLAKETYLVGTPGHVTMALSYEYEILEDARQGSDYYPNLEHMFTSNNTIAIEAIYGVSKNISFSMLVPFKSIQNTTVADSTVILGLSDEAFRPFNYSRSARGLGDVIVMTYIRANFGSLLRFGDEYYPASDDDYDNYDSYYSFDSPMYAGKRQGPALALALGLRLPTGKNDITDQFGNRIDDDLQLGSGTMDPIIGLMYFQRMYRMGWGLSGLVRISSQENIYHYEWGNEFIASGYVSYRVTRKMEFINHFNLTHLGRDLKNGMPVTNRGASILLMAPSMVFEGPGGVTFQATAQVPLYRDFNEVQLSSDYVINLRTSFDLK